MVESNFGDREQRDVLHVVYVITLGTAATQLSKAPAPGECCPYWWMGIADCAWRQLLVGEQEAAQRGEPARSAGPGPRGPMDFACRSVAGADSGKRNEGGEK